MRLQDIPKLDPRLVVMIGALVILGGGVWNASLFERRDRVLESGSDVTALVTDMRRTTASRHRSDGYLVSYRFKILSQVYEGHWYYYDALFPEPPFDLNAAHPAMIKVRYDAQDPSFNLPADAPGKEFGANTERTEGPAHMLSSLLIGLGVILCVFGPLVAWLQRRADPFADVVPSEDA